MQAHGGDLETSPHAAEHFRSLFDHHPDGVFALDLDGYVGLANRAGSDLLVLDAHEVVGHHYRDFVAPGDRERAADAFDRIVAGGRVRMSLMIERGDGTLLEAEVISASTLVDDIVVGGFVIMRDIAEQRRVERDTLRHNARIRELFMAAAVDGGSAGEQIARTIAIGCRLLGCDDGSVFEVGRESGEPSRVPPELERLALAVEGPLAIDDVAMLPSGAAYPQVAAFIGTPIFVGGNVCGTINFIARQARRDPFTEIDRDLAMLIGALMGSTIERRRSREQLNRIAYYDSLTGMANRVAFLERLREELRTVAAGETRRIAVLFIDLDHFKEINDTYGHGRGDAVLGIVGDRLRDAVEGRGLVARTGGDEFAVLLTTSDVFDDLDLFAESLRATIDAPILVDGFEQYITPSIGIALYPSDGDDAETLVKHADVAMYRAKERGRNLVQFFTPVLNAALTTRLQQEKALRKALSREEFVVYYQPQFDLASGALCGVEALVRWQHPKLGLIRPDLFIPNAELSSVIVSLGERVMDLAARQVVRWQALGHPNLRVAINLSARQFRESDLVTRLTDVLASSGLPPETLEIEITESVAMDDAARSVEIMRSLRSAGIRICLDDFGTGYSSLGYLRRFPLDTLKIDKSFVRDIMREPDDATIVQTVIAMAHNLGLDVCAEGVETIEQLKFLRTKACDRVQGYYFSVALPPDDFTAYLAERSVGERPALG